MMRNLENYTWHWISVYRYAIDGLVEEDHTIALFYKTLENFVEDGGLVVVFWFYIATPHGLLLMIVHHMNESTII